MGKAEDRRVSTEDNAARPQTSSTDKGFLPIFMLTLRVTEVLELPNVSQSQNQTLNHLNYRNTSDREEAWCYLRPPHSQGHITIMGLSLQNVPLPNLGTLPWTTLYRKLIMGVRHSSPRAPSSQQQGEWIPLLPLQQAAHQHPCSTTAVPLESGRLFLLPAAADANLLPL